MLRDPLARTRKQSPKALALPSSWESQKLVVGERYLRSLKIKHSSGRGKDQGPTRCEICPHGQELVPFMISQISDDLSTFCAWVTETYEPFIVEDAIPGNSNSIGLESLDKNALKSARLDGCD